MKWHHSNEQPAKKAMDLIWLTTEWWLEEEKCYQQGKTLASPYRWDRQYQQMDQLCAVEVTLRTIKQSCEGLKETHPLRTTLHQHWILVQKVEAIRETPIPEVALELAMIKLHLLQQNFIRCKALFLSPGLQFSPNRMSLTSIWTFIWPKLKTIDWIWRTKNCKPFWRKKETSFSSNLHSCKHTRIKLVSCVPVIPYNSCNPRSKAKSRKSLWKSMMWSFTKIRYANSKMTYKDFSRQIGISWATFTRRIANWRTCKLLRRRLSRKMHWWTSFRAKLILSKRGWQIIQACSTRCSMKYMKGTRGQPSIERLLGMRDSPDWRCWNKLIKSIWRMIDSRES